MFVNEPTYSIGDQLNFSGSSAIEREPGYEYYYSESANSVGERYTYSASGQTDYVESYYYTSFDEGGVIVTDISLNSNAYEYDAEGRVVQEVDYSYYEKANEYITDNLFVSNYYYASSTGVELESSTILSVYTREDGRVETLVAENEYTYNANPIDKSDYAQVRSVVATDYETDGITDFTSYSLQSLEYNDFNDNYNNYVSVTYDSPDTQTASFINNVSSSITGTGYTDAFEQLGAYDQNADGIIDYEYANSRETTYDADGNALSYESYYFYKYDSDYDGKADRVIIENGSGDQSGGKKIGIDWEDQGSSGSYLYINIYKDTDGDFSYDTSRSFRIEFDAPSGLTRMGGHVASIDDTLLVESSAIA